MSGLKFPSGVYYCPESLAFQIPIDSVAGDKVKMSFAWARGRLESITTTFEEPKGYGTYRSMTSDVNTNVTLPAAALKEVGNFYFQYPTTPGSALLSASTKPPVQAAPAKTFRVHVTHDPGHLRMVDDENQTEIVLRSNPIVDPVIMNQLEGPVGTIVAGNSYFNPFLWDGLHYFTVQYDSLGRVETAQEWAVDNLVRFSWDGQRLTAIHAYKKGVAKPYYERTISYSGALITSEDFTLNLKPGHIKYVYSNNQSLQRIKVENEGKDWTVTLR